MVWSDDGDLTSRITRLVLEIMLFVDTERSLILSQVVVTVQQVLGELHKLYKNPPGDTKQQQTRVHELYDYEQLNHHIDC